MKILIYHTNPLLTWFRIFGYGLCFRDKNFSRYSDTFSERIGAKKYLDAFGYRITFLTPNTFPKSTKL